MIFFHGISFFPLSTLFILFMVLLITCRLCFSQSCTLLKLVNWLNVSLIMSFTRLVLFFFCGLWNVLPCKLIQTIYWKWNLVICFFKIILSLICNAFDCKTLHWFGIPFSITFLIFLFLKIEYFCSYVGLVFGTIYELVVMVAGILMIFFFVLQISTFHHSIMCKFVDLEIWKTFVST